MDRNYNIPPDSVLIIESLSARRAWIEILKARTNQNQIYVALRKESVDRNNQNKGEGIVFRAVALRKESVDRNFDFQRHIPPDARSLSARRAWIEISTPWPKAQCP